MEFFRKTNINFQGNRRIAITCSAIFILAGFISLIVRGGPNYSIDFSGGTGITLRFAGPVSEGEVRSVLNEIKLGDSEVKTIGGGGSHPDILIRVKETAVEAGTVTLVENTIRKGIPDNTFEVLQIEKVGPKIGKELKGKAVWAMVVSLIGILIYLAWRFEFKFAVGAVIATAHDLFAMLALFSLTNLEISLGIVAAFLTIAGYSINDTVVVYDRIRENIKKLRSATFFDIINISINETLSRTILTGSTTLMVLIVLFFLGGQVIHDFAFALLVGILIGTYSSIFIAAPILLEWEARTGTKKKKL